PVVWTFSSSFSRREGRWCLLLFSPVLWLLADVGRPFVRYPCCVYYLSLESEPLIWFRLLFFHFFINVLVEFGEHVFACGADGADVLSVFSGDVWDSVAVVLDFVEDVVVFDYPIVGVFDDGGAVCCGHFPSWW